MKTPLILILLSLICKFSYCQTNTFPTSGNVGIGTTSPTTKLEITGGTDWTSNHWKKSVKLNSSQAIQWSSSNTYFGIGGTTNPEALYFFSTTADDNSSSAKYIMVMKDNGNVGIGTINPGEKLSVNGKIRAQEIKVETANWPDYVFSRDYQLPSLKDTEQHIKAKGHLVDIPSAEDVKSNGIDLGEMNAKLLKKIEELTLYVIELDKVVKNQQKEINQLRDKN